MDSVGIHTRISPARSYVLATLVGATVVVGAACSAPSRDAKSAYQATLAQERADEARPAVRGIARGSESMTAPEVAPGSPSRRALDPVEFAGLESAIERFAADRAGRLPKSLDELAEARSPEGDRYVRSLPTDAWGRPYAYAVVSVRLGTYDLRSYGPDTLPGTDDDVVADARPVLTH